MPTTKLLWNNIESEPAASGQMADVNGHRATVRLQTGRMPVFIAKIDGTVIGEYTTLEAAMLAVETLVQIAPEVPL